MTSINVGDTLPPLPVGVIDRTTLALFAGASGDHNPMHIDIDVAQSVGLDDVFAHGMLSMAHLGRLLTNWVRQEHIVSFEVRFAAITPVNAEPICTGTLRSIEADVVTIDIKTVLPDGTITLSGSATLAAAAFDEGPIESRTTSNPPIQGAR